MICKPRKALFTSGTKQTGTHVDQEDGLDTCTWGLTQGIVMDVRGRAGEQGGNLHTDLRVVVVHSYLEAGLLHQA